MKSLLKIGNMNDSQDVAKIQNAISVNEGIIACEVSLRRKEVQIIYNDTIISEDKIIDSIENMGFMVF